MSPRNKALIRRWIEEVQKGNVDVTDEVLAPDFVDHSLLPGQRPDREGYRRGLSDDRDAFSDLEITIEDQSAESDKVVTRYRWRGTHTRGRLLNVPATGRKVEATAIVVHRIVGGKVKEEWSASDTLGMLRQLEVTPGVGRARGNQPGLTDRGSPDKKLFGGCVQRWLLARLLVPNRGGESQWVSRC